MFASLSIRAKITSLVAVLLVAMSGLGLLGVLKMRTLNDSTVDIATNWMPSIRELGDLRTSIALYRNAIRTHLLEQTAEGKANIAKRLATIDASIKTTQGKYEKMISSPEEKLLYDDWRKEWGHYTEEATKALALSDKSIGQFPTEAVEYLAKTVFPIGERVDAVLKKDVDLNNKGGEDSTASAASTYSAALFMVIAIVLAAVAIGIVSSIVVIRDVAQGIAAIVQPIKVVSTEGLWRGFDVKVVDGAVNGAGYLVSGVSIVLRLLQNGSVKTYAASMFAGVVALLAYYFWR